MFIFFLYIQNGFNKSTIRSQGVFVNKNQPLGLWGRQEWRQNFIETRNKLSQWFKTTTSNGNKLPTTLIQMEPPPRGDHPDMPHMNVRNAEINTFFTIFDVRINA